MKEFRGFSGETVRFFEELVENNDRVWFERNRGSYVGKVNSLFKFLP